MGKNDYGISVRKSARQKLNFAEKGVCEAIPSNLIRELSPLKYVFFFILPSFFSFQKRRKRQPKKKKEESSSDEDDVTFVDNFKNFGAYWCIIFAMRTQKYEKSVRKYFSFRSG